MPELLQEGLPAKRTRKSAIDFAEWTDGQAWKFVKGEDYQSTTDTFRTAVKRWAKENGYEVELRSYPELDPQGEPIPLAKVDGIALGVQFLRDRAA